MARGDTTIKLREDTRKLPVLLNPEELAQRSGRLAQVIQDRIREEDDQKLAKAAMKQKLDLTNDDIADLSDIVVARHEPRDVQIVVEFLSEGMVRETRKDTGEIISVRPPGGEASS